MPGGDTALRLDSFMLRTVFKAPTLLMGLFLVALAAGVVASCAGNSQTPSGGPIDSGTFDASGDERDASLEPDALFDASLSNRDVSAPESSSPDGASPVADAGRDATVEGGLGLPDADAAETSDASTDACPAGSIVCSAVCVDPATDPANCGTCAHSCMGGACSAAVCQPVVLASGQGCPTSIVVDSTSVYWTDWLNASNGGAVMRAPLDGGSAVQLADAGYAAYGLAVDGTNAYWSNYYGHVGVAMVPLDGGPPTQLAAYSSGSMACAGVAVAGSEVYFATNVLTTGDVRRVPIDGGSPTLLTPEEPYAYGEIFAMGPDGIYWQSNHTLLRVSLDGGAPTTLATGVTPHGLAVDPASAYLTEQAGGLAGNSVMRIPLDGAAPVTLQSNLPSPQAIAVDSTGIYWTDYPYTNPAGSNGTVLMAPLDGGAAHVLATGQSSPKAIAVDATRVYWVDCPTDLDAGTVMAVVKP
jgi:hypothetical protein